MTYSDFKFYVGETFEYCQTIEQDVKWIFSAMRKGDIHKNFESIGKWTLGKSVIELEQMDNSDGDPFLSAGDYESLCSITKERDYLAHQIFRDFLYVEDCFNSNEYRIACSRLVNFHNRLSKLQDIIEDVRLKAVAKYKR